MYELLFTFGVLLTWVAFAFTEILILIYESARKVIKWIRSVINGD